MAAALLQRAAECVLHGGDASLLDTVSEPERVRLVLTAASRRDEPRRYLISNVQRYLPHASIDELIGIGIRAWGERPVHDELAARGEAALPALTREAERLIERDGEDEDWLVAVAARIAALHARRGEPFPERLRPIIDQALAKAVREVLERIARSGR